MSESDLALQTLLARLRTPEAAGRLAERWVADLLARPLAELAPPGELARWTSQLLSAGASSAQLRRWVDARIAEMLSEKAVPSVPLRNQLGAEVVDVSRKLAARPYSPDRALVLAVLDREPVRKLIRELLVDVLIEFGRKIASLASPLTGSRVGRKLGALGALAGAVGSGVVGAVSGELEKQVEKRAAEFADLGISRVLQHLVELISDPSLASDQAEFRVALLEGFLDLRASDLAREARRQDPGAIAEVVRAAVLAHWNRPESRASLESRLRSLPGVDAQLSLGSLLDELGLRTEVEAVMRDLLTQRAKAFDWGGWIQHELSTSAPA